MAERLFDAADLDALRRWDTPTICNAIELVTPARRGRGFTTKPFTAADPDWKGRARAAAASSTAGRGRGELSAVVEKPPGARRSPGGLSKSISCGRPGISAAAAGRPAGAKESAHASARKTFRCPCINPKLPPRPLRETIEQSAPS